MPALTWKSGASALHKAFRIVRLQPWWFLFRAPGSRFSAAASPSEKAVKKDGALAARGSYPGTALAVRKATNIERGFSPKETVF